MKTRPSLIQPLVRAILKAVAKVPDSKETMLKGDRAEARVKELLDSASWKAAAISGGLSLPGGAIGIATIVPDLVATWRIQAQLVADIAAVYGRSEDLTREELFYCLFNYGRQSPLKDLLIRTGERLVVRKTSARLLEQLSEKVGLRLARRLLGEGFARLLPLVGAITVARYSRQDTRLVGVNARDLFA